MLFRSQSSRALEENPFGDHFTRSRSSSDPWSSYTHQAATATSCEFEYDESGFNGLATTTRTVESHDEYFAASAVTVEVESHSSSVPTAASDPFDSANLLADDKPASPLKLITSPGLLESRHSAENDPSVTPESPLQHTFQSEPVFHLLFLPKTPFYDAPTRKLAHCTASLPRDTFIYHSCGARRLFRSAIPTTTTTRTTTAAPICSAALLAHSFQPSFFNN